MIFPGHMELFDIADYRERAMHRKMDYYAQHYPEQQFSVNQLEFEILECIERIREKEVLPFVDVIEKNSASDARTSPTVDVPKVWCDFNEYGDYIITYDWNMAVKLGRYVEFIFGKPWTELQISLRKNMGIAYKQYEKSIYDFPAFKKFDACRVNLADYIRKMASWFIGLHELAHIKNGHLYLIRAVNNKKKNISLDTRRALELHADISASVMLLNILTNWQKYVGVPQRIRQDNGKNPGITYCDEIAYAALAAYLALRCCLKHERWDEYTVCTHEFMAEGHPLTELRMAVIYNILLQGLMDLGTNREEKLIFASNFQRMIQQFEDFWFENVAEEGEEQFFYKPTELLRTEAGKQYYHKLFDELIGLGDLLKEYTDHLVVVEGKWMDYETLPERMLWE